MSLREKINADIVRNRQRIRQLGPGFITGGAGDDPAGIVTYTVVGATAGLSQLWLLLLSTPMMIAVQATVARIAIVTGKSLPEITTAFYSQKLAILMVSILSIANILTIGADLNAIAAILHLATGYPGIHFLIPVTALLAYLVMFGHYKTIKGVLITLTIVLVVYVISAVMAKPDLISLIKSTFIPEIKMQSAWVIAALGLLGTTISPYLMFWQAAEEKEEQKSVVQADEIGFDTVVGMIYSNLLAYCMIITGAVLLYGTGRQIQDISGLAGTLEPVAGQNAFLFFSIGVVVSGFLAIPVLAGSTAYAVADTFRWREGINHKVSDAKGFYIVFIGALIIGDLIDLIPSVSVVDALYYSQVLDGLLIPVLIGISLMISNNRAIMGEYTGTRFNNFFSLVALAVTLVLSIIMIFQIL